MSSLHQEGYQESNSYGSDHESNKHMHETLPKWVPHLITPELDPINAHGHSDTSQHEGKCDEGEVTEERDTALN